MTPMSDEERKNFAKKLLSQDCLPERIISCRKELETMLQRKITIGTRILWCFAAIICAGMGLGFFFVINNAGAFFPYVLAILVSFALAGVFLFYSAREYYGFNFQSILTILLVVFVVPIFIYVVFDYSYSKEVSTEADIILWSVFVAFFAIIPLISWIVNRFSLQILREIKELRIEVADLREKICNNVNSTSGK